MTSSERVTISCSVSTREWVDIPTPKGPDVQVRWAGHKAIGGETPTVTLEWRVKPTVQELEEQGITREESNRT